MITKYRVKRQNLILCATLSWEQKAWGDSYGAYHPSIQVIPLISTDLSFSFSFISTISFEIIYLVKLKMKECNGFFK